MATVAFGRASDITQIPVEDGKLVFQKIGNKYDIWLDCSINNTPTRLRVTDSSLSTAIGTHINNTDNPHNLTAAQIAAILGYTPVSGDGIDSAVESKVEEIMENLSFSVNLNDGCLYWQ